MFLKWQTPEDCLTSMSIILLTMAGITIMIIDHETKARQKRLASLLTQGFWKFTPRQIDNPKQRKLKWMKFFLAGVMMACTVTTITVKYFKVKKTLVLGVNILVGWVTFLSVILNRKDPVKIKTVQNRELEEKNYTLFGWKARQRVSAPTTTTTTTTSTGGVASSSTSSSFTEDTRLPVTIVTGYLGSGKTTLIKRILDNTAGIKVLIIENEIGK